MLRRLDIIVRLDQEPLDTCLDVLADVARLCEGIAVAYCKGYIELLAQSPGGFVRLRDSYLGDLGTYSSIYVFPTPVGPSNSRLLLSIFTCCGRSTSSDT